MGLFDLPVILLIAFVALLVFGPKRLPGLGKSVGTNMKEFKEAVTGDDKGEEPNVIEAPPAPVPPVTQAPPVAQPVAAPVEPAPAPPAQPARFDPVTGQPLDPAAHRFDPVTGQPLTPQPPADDA